MGNFGDEIHYTTRLFSNEPTNKADSIDYSLHFANFINLYNEFILTLEQK
jgi:hypothetical protein